MTRLPLSGRVTPLSTGAVLLVAIFVAVAVLLDPFRELMTWDDGWAYARSVETLLANGRYTLDQWSAANMPVQIGLATVLAKIFGYSLTLLRLITMALLLVLLLGFRRLARDLGSPPEHAFLLSLGLFASPVLLMLSFTFMSDVQFLAWLVLALMLYERGLRTGRLGLILLGSAAAACAIGTRQFGIAILGGWALAWLLSARGERPSIRIVAAAVALPLSFTAWQLWMGTGQPNFTQAYRLAEQRAFLAQPVRALAKEAIWRGAVWIQYAALYLLPIAPLILGAGLVRLAEAPTRVRLRGALLTAAIMAFVAFGLTLNSALTVRPPIVQGPAWPALGVIWMLPVQPWATPRVQKLIDLAGFAAIAPLAWLLLSRPDLLPRHRPQPATLLIGGTALALLGLLFGYVQFNDTYVVALLPFLLLAVGAAIREARPSRLWMAATLLCSLGMLAGVTALTRHAYDEQQLAWREADEAAAGRTPSPIVGNRYKHWAEYHGAFDRWIAAGAPGLKPPPRQPRIGEDPFHDSFYLWLHDRELRDFFPK